LSNPEVPEQPEQPEPTNEPQQTEPALPAEQLESTEQPKPSSPLVSKFKALPIWARIAIPAGALLIVVALIAAVIAAVQPSRFVSALDVCGLESNSAARVGDSGNSLILDMEGEDDPGQLSYNEMFCVLDALDLPDSVEAQMGETRSLDGRQTAEWDGINASWSYHPDDGLDLILSLD
tara:strand:- start:16149 stop:16682 length:534 start_codon:yes stop_codon:yes gene_type:complete